MSESTKSGVGSAQSNQYHLKVAVLGTTDTATTCSDARDEVSAKCFRGGWASTQNTYSLTSTNHDASEAVCRFHDSMASLSSGTGSHGVAPPLHVNGRTISSAVTDQRPLVWATPDIDMTGLSRIGESLSRGDKRGVLGGGGATMTFLNDGTAHLLSYETGGKLTITNGDLLTVFGFDSNSAGTAVGTNVNFNVTLSGCSNAAYNKEYSIIAVTATELEAGTDDVSTSAPLVVAASGGICAGDTITLSTSLATLVDTDAIAVGDRFKVAATSRHTNMENVYAKCTAANPTVCTVTNAAGDINSNLGHGFATGDTVTTAASTTGTGLTASTEYFVDRIDAASFNLRASSLGVANSAAQIAVTTSPIVTTFTKSTIRYETRTVDKIWKDATSGDVTMFSVADQFKNVRNLQNVEAWIDESGSTEQAECSNRGICDSEAGVCECFTGYTSNNCGVQSALAE
jgi:hypothetical protein